MKMEWQNKYKKYIQSYYLSVFPFVFSPQKYPKYKVVFLLTPIKSEGSVFESSQEDQSCFANPNLFYYTGYAFT